MRLIYLLLLTLIFTSCGYHKLRFSKVDKRQKVVELNEVSSMKKKTETVSLSSVDVEEETMVETETLSIASAVEEDLSSPETSQHSVNTAPTTFPETVEDSTVVTPQEAEVITEEALKAERNGTSSLFFSIMIFVFSILALITLILGFGYFSETIMILGITFTILVLVSIVLSAIFGIRSLRAQYNTPKGRRRAIIGLTIAGLYVLLMLFNIALSF